MTHILLLVWMHVDWLSWAKRIVVSRFMVDHLIFFWWFVLFILYFDITWHGKVRVVSRRMVKWSKLPGLVSSRWTDKPHTINFRFVSVITFFLKHSSSAPEAVVGSILLHDARFSQLLYDSMQLSIFVHRANNLYHLTLKFIMRFIFIYEIFRLWMCCFFRVILIYKVEVLKYVLLRRGFNSVGVGTFLLNYRGLWICIRLL